MKTQRILAVVFALVFAATMNVRANVKGGSGISSDSKFAYSLHSVKGSDKIVLSFDNLAKEKVSIKIYDKNQELVFSERQYDAKEMRKLYDLSGLAKGVYTVTIESGSNTFSEEIEIGKDWNELDFETVIAPDATNAHKLRVGFANAKTDVTVEIKDAAGNLIHSETFTDAQNANQLFNMDGLTSGVYSITVSANGNSQTENYIVK